MEVCLPLRDHSVSPCRSRRRRCAKTVTQPIVPHAGAPPCLYACLDGQRDASTCGRQSKGWGSQDDDGGVVGCGDGGEGSTGAARRPRPTGLFDVLARPGPRQAGGVDPRGAARRCGAVRGAGADGRGNDAVARQHRPGRRRGDAVDARGPRIRAQARAREGQRRLRRGDHRLPAVARRAHPQRADRRGRRDGAAAVRDAGTPRRRPVPADDHRRSADHQRRPQAARRASHAVRLTHHTQPRRAARRRRPLRPAGAGSADSAHRSVRRGHRIGCLGDRRQEEQGRVAYRELATALLKHWKSGKALPTFAPEV